MLKFVLAEPMNWALQSRARLAKACRILAIGPYLVAGGLRGPGWGWPSNQTDRK
jgi:hypothetical protein